MIDSNNSTATLPNYPCIGCKRKDCTISSFYGNRCEFAVYHDYTFASGHYDYKPPRNYVKKQKNKKRVYHRGKF